MTLRVVDQAEKIFLDAILASNTELRLFKNNVENGLTDTQKDALTESSFTEATFTGYASAALIGGTWTSASGNPASAYYTAVPFVSTADQTPQTLYGYYVTRQTDHKLLWYEYFNGSVAGSAVIQNQSESIIVTPRLTLADTSSGG